MDAHTKTKTLEKRLKQKAIMVPAERTRSSLFCRFLDLGDVRHLGDGFHPLHDDLQFVWCTGFARRYDHLLVTSPDG